MKAMPKVSTFPAGPVELMLAPEGKIRSVRHADEAILLLDRAEKTARALAEQSEQLWLAVRPHLDQCRVWGKKARTFLNTEHY